MAQEADDIIDMSSDSQIGDHELINDTAVNCNDKDNADKQIRSESNMDNLRTEATTPMLVNNNTYVNTLHTDVSVNDVSQDYRIAFANLNDEDLDVIPHLDNNNQNKQKDDDEISVQNI